MTLHRLPHRITPMQPHDEALVMDTWLRTYRDSPHTRKWSDDAYDAYQRPKIGSIIERSIVLVARPLDWDEGILGWLCFEQRPEVFTLHYAYTKNAYRMQGLMKSMLANAGPYGERRFTHLRPPYTGYLPSGFTFQKVHR